MALASVSGAQACERKPGTRAVTPHRALRSALVVLCAAVLGAAASAIPSAPALALGGYVGGDQQGVDAGHLLDPRLSPHSEDCEIAGGACQWDSDFETQGHGGQRPARSAAGVMLGTTTASDPLPVARAGGHEQLDRDGRASLELSQPADAGGSPVHPLVTVAAVMLVLVTAALVVVVGARLREPIIAGPSGVLEPGMQRGERGLERAALVKYGTIVAEVAAIFALVFGLKFGIEALFVEPFRVWSTSMVPTLAVDDRILVDRISARSDDPHRGDIVVFNPPAGAADNSCGVQRPVGQACEHATAGRLDALFVKRVVGLPGDQLKVLNGMVYIDGQLQDDPDYRPDGACDACNLPKEITVPPGHIFLMGDNRAHSDDSRHWGPVPRAWLTGRVLTRYWPLGRFGSPELQVSSGPQAMTGEPTSVILDAV